MKKIIIAIGLAISILLAGIFLTFLSKGEEPSEKFLKKYRPFLDYTFDKDYKISRDVSLIFESRFRSVYNEKYKIRYKDQHGVNRKFVIRPLHSSYDIAMREETERHLRETLRYEVRKIIEPVATKYYNIEVTPKRYFGESKFNNHRRKKALIKPGDGLKMVNIDGFMKGKGTKIYKVIDIEVGAATEDRDKIRELEREIVLAIRDFVGPKYDIRVTYR